jgi:hypothetical protein
MMAVRLGKFIVAIGLLLVCTGSWGQSNSDQRPQYIGKASMSADGTIALSLFMTGDGKHADAQFTYKTNDPNYQMIIRHVGGIKPGEIKPVPPFPDQKKAGDGDSGPT